MKKTILFIFAALIGTNAKASFSNSFQKPANDGQSQQAAALSYLIQSGAVNVNGDGTLHVDQDLVSRLKSAGLVQTSPNVEVSSQCFEAPK